MKVFLPDSYQYEFVLVEDEYIAHDGKRIQVFVRQSSSKTILVPVRPYKLGNIPIRAQGISGDRRTSVENSVTVTDRGEPHRRHTSVQVWYILILF